MPVSLGVMELLIILLGLVVVARLMRWHAERSERSTAGRSEEVDLAQMAALLEKMEQRIENLETILGERNQDKDNVSSGDQARR